MASKSGISDKNAPQGQKPPFFANLALKVKQRIHNLGLLPRLLIAEALVFGLVFAGGVFLVSRVAHSLRGDIQKERLLLGKAAAADLDAALTDSIGDLRHVAIEYEAAAAGNPPQGSSLAGVLSEERNMFTGGMMALGSQGQVLEAPLHGISLTDVDVQQLWYNLSSQAATSSSVQAAPFNVSGKGGPFVALAIPIEQNGTGGFVIGLIGLQDSYPARVVARAVSLGGSGHADIVDQQGVALFSTETQHLLLTSDHPVSYRDLFIQGQTAVAELPHTEHPGTAEGEPHLMAFVPLQALPWAIAVGTTVSDAYAPVRQLWYGSVGFLLLLTGMSFGLTILVARTLVKPVTTLSQAARSVAEGDRSVTVRTPWGGEIGELAQSLETMRLHLQAWGSELEKEVQGRTAELKARNQELGELYKTLQGKEEQLRTLLGKVLAAQEDERRRVSRELHDGIGQALSALTMGLERLEQSMVGQQPQTNEQVQNLAKLANDSLSDLRRLTIALRPAALDDLGLVPAIRRYAEFYLGGSGVDLQVKEEGPAIRLDAPLEAVVYRVVQEAINNIARHSEATKANVLFHSEDHVLVATVEDNGRGFEPTDEVFVRGVGLQGMRERASLVGGKLTVESRPGQGTKVRLEVPVVK